jgi:hypothetical protein
MRRINDPTWVFLDNNVIRFRIVTSDFLRYPTLYYFDLKAGLQKRSVISITPGGATVVPQLGKGGDMYATAN